jgi:serine protease Do
MITTQNKAYKPSENEEITMKKHFATYLMSILLAGIILTGCGVNILPTKAASPASAQTTQTSAEPAQTTQTSAEPAQTAQTSAVATDILAPLESRLENIYTQANPSVVNIQVVQKQVVSTPALPGFPFFSQPPTTPQGPQEFFRQGAGSGFVWDKEGDIVTNNHVVANADTITVTFADGTTVPADVVGTDPDSDLAVVKVNVPADQLQPVQMTDSSQVKVGQVAIAIGNPFALKGTMTVGFISAVGRSIPTNLDNTQGPTYTIPDIIQTDAPINPGNSGGVLLNDQGQVIGVTSAIISSDGSSAGIGFAIPSAIVQQVVPVLIKTGQYDHPWLGISGTSLNPDLADAAKLKTDQRGALVVEVVPGSPADKAGLHGSDRQTEINGQVIRVGGDVITAIDGQPVQSFDDLIAYLLTQTTVNQQVTLTILRDGKEQTVQVTLVARPQPETQHQQVENTTTASNQAWLGLRGATMNPLFAQAMNLPRDQQGILVGQVEIDSPADQAGLQGSYKPVTINGQQLLVGGDVIIAVDGQPITQIEDLQAFLSQAHSGQKVTFTILRDGKQMEVPITLGEHPAATP